MSDRASRRRDCRAATPGGLCFRAYHQGVVELVSIVSDVCAHPEAKGERAIQISGVALPAEDQARKPLLTKRSMAYNTTPYIPTHYTL